MKLKKILSKHMNTNVLITLALPILFLTSCATKFTTAQLAELSTLAIMNTNVQSNAYAEPDGGDRQMAASAGVAGVNSQAGAIGSVVVSLIGESIAATQNSLYRKNNKHLFGAVQRNTPAVGGILNAQLVTSMKKEPFFGSRLRKVSPNYIKSSITSYRLVRSGKDQSGDLLLTPQLVADMELFNASGKKLAGGTYLGTGYSHSIAEYAGSAKKTKEGYELAARIAVDQFTTALAQKVAE